MLSSNVQALPEQGQVTSGRAEFQRPDMESLVISTSEKVIINFEKFSIAQNERVQFVQPSDRSCVLNRITGGDPSQILGRLSANGRVFLVNPNGVYFGPDAVVNTGSLLVSTLNIRDSDFLAERYKFFVEPGCERATIVNEGRISANREGFVAFCAPVIENRGVVRAQAGKVAFASAERVTLDFAGDGLIRFALEGDLERAVMENYGEIDALHGDVEMSMRTAKSLAKTVVNTDGIESATSIVECHGVIRLVGGNSSITAKNIRIEGEQGSEVIVGGRIQARNERRGQRGGRVHILGDRTQLVGADIDASGHSGGGEVLVGGDYKGEGVVRNALMTSMDEASQIHVDALHEGDGGRAILWADRDTTFNGQIWARGGIEGGDGGFVETSGKENLIMQVEREVGPVYTDAPRGEYGLWLLDPASINIVTGGGATLANCQSPNCATSGAQSIAPATFTGSASNISLCATNATNSSITVSNSITMSNSGVNLTLTAGSTNLGTITINSSLIRTRGGSITLNGVVVLGINTTLDTTNNGGTTVGDNITFSNTVNGARTLTLTGGTIGIVTMNGAVGGTTALTSLTATGATITQSSSSKATGAISFTGSSAINLGGNVTTSGGAISMTGPVTATATTTLDSTNAGGTAAGANITLSSTANGSLLGLTLNAGTGGTAGFGAIGGTAPFTSLAVTAATINQNSTVKTDATGVTYTANAINIGGNIVTNDGPIVITGPVVLTADALIDPTNGGASPSGDTVTFTSTINGAHNLTINAGNQNTTRDATYGAVGGTTPLTSFTVTADTIFQNSTVETTGAVTYTGAVGINLGGNITTSGGAIQLTGATTLTVDATLDATNAGGTAAGGNVVFWTSVNGARNLTMTSGTAGQTYFGAAGTTTALTSYTATGATHYVIGGLKTTGAVSVNASAGINLSSTVTTSGGTVNMIGPINMYNANATIDTTNGGLTAAGANITLANPIDGAFGLTLTAGTGGTSYFNTLGSTTPLTFLTASGATVTQIFNALK